jgi:hypothetical protein
VPDGRTECRGDALIHEIGRDLEAKLRAKGCAFTVVDREEFKRTGWVSNRIVIDETGDTFGPARSQSINPRRYYTGNIGASIRVYAKSAKAGAKEFEHRRLARVVVDLCLVALRTIRAERKTGLAIGAGAFVEIEDLEGSSSKGGAVYDLAFTVERGVADRTFAGAIAAEANLTAIAMAGAPSLTFDATNDTITRGAGSWAADGFAVGMTVRVHGSASNNVTGPITILTPTVLTLGTTSLANEGPVSGCTVEAGGITSTTLVSDPAGGIPELACGA